MANVIQKSLILPLIISSVLSQVSVSPEELVVAEGGDSVFTCISPSSTETIEWLINGTSLNEGHRRDGVTQERDIVLRFRNASTEYNNTKIQCRAGSEISPTPSLLLVQGPPGAVKSLVAIDGVDNVTVRWTAPFTLDIPRVEPDISGYCVDVVSSTSSATLHSECGIIETEFTYPLPPRSWCDVYNITVTPVNVVGNGTIKSILYSRELEGPELIEVISTSINFTLRMSAPVCSAKLTFRDTVSRNVTTLKNSDLTLSESTITFSSQLLTPNRKYEMRILAINIRKNTTSNTQISTYDIESCSLVKGAETVTIYVTFTEHSEATGAMLNFVYINNDNVTIDFAKSSCLIAEKNSISQGLALPLDMWYSGQYMFYVYDIESNREIMNGLQYQANDCNFTAVGQGTTPSQNQSCNISSTGGMITVECSSLERFQVTAQRNSIESANVLHVSSSVDPQTPATIQVTKSGEYLLAVLPIENGRGILSGKAFSQIHTVTDDGATIQDSITLMPLVTSSIQLQAKWTIIGLGGGLACLSLLSAVLTTALVIQCCKQSCRSKVKVQLNQPPAEVGGVLSPDDETAGTQMYEEIKEPASAPPTQRPAPRVPPPALVPQYEDVEISAASNTKHSYQITTCAAYGVTLNNQ